MTNQIDENNVDANTGEIAVQEETNVEVVQRETDEFVVVKENGKYKRKAKYKEYSSITPKTREEKMWLLNVVEGDENDPNSGSGLKTHVGKQIIVADVIGDENDPNSGSGLKTHVGKQIIVADVITRTYDRINEDTGKQEYGVLTYLINPEKQVFVTSSKTVYFSIIRIMDLFGKPDEEGWENVTVKVGKEKGLNGDIIKIKMIG